LAKSGGKGRTQGGGGRHLRIIGGQWRGRRLQFPELPGLRPTGDRIRETLFNWLAPDIVGARCLDLFAGSGALGLEALSRGAAHCDFVERDRTAAASLRSHIDSLAAHPRARVLEADALAFLRGCSARYDIVFLDPPFAADLLAASAASLADGGHLEAGARIYTEQDADEVCALPSTWRELRRKQSGNVAYALLTAVDPEDAPPA